MLNFLRKVILLAMVAMLLCAGCGLQSDMPLGGRLSSMILQ